MIPIIIEEQTNNWFALLLKFGLIEPTIPTTTMTTSTSITTATTMTMSTSITATSSKFI